MRLRPLLALAVLVGAPAVLAPAALAQPADGYADPTAVVGPRRLSGPRMVGVMHGHLARRTQGTSAGA